MAQESKAFQREPLVSSEHEIVALVAHELRHPLTAIEAALPLLMDAPQPQTRQKARRVIERQVMYLRRLVDDLLDEKLCPLGAFVLQDAFDCIKPFPRFLRVEIFLNIHDVFLRRFISRFYARCSPVYCCCAVGVTRLAQGVFTPDFLW